MKVLLITSSEVLQYPGAFRVTGTNGLSEEDRMDRCLHRFNRSIMYQEGNFWIAANTSELEVVDFCRERGWEIDKEYRDKFTIELRRK